MWLLVACAPASTLAPPATEAPAAKAITVATAAPTAAAPSPAPATAQPTLPTAASSANPLAAQPTAMSGSAAKPVARTPQCGETVRESLVLAADMKCVGDAIVVGASDITIDLGGRKIVGPGTGSPTWPRPNLQSVGVRVSGHERVTIRNGFVEAFSSGLLIEKSTGSLVQAIDSRESYYGIYLKDGTKNRVADSKFVTNVYGITLFESNGNVIERNEANRSRHLSPGGYGVYVYGSRENRFVENSFDSNVNWGIWLSSSKDNIFARNNVVRNNPQVSDDTGGNVWHDPATHEGNFWADWEGKELPGTGIGDHAYLVWGPGGATDPYPFVRRDGWKESGRAPPPRAGAAPALAAGAGARGPWVGLGISEEVGSVAPDGAALERRISLGKLGSNVAWSPDGLEVYVVDAAPPQAAVAAAASGPALLTIEASSGAVKRAEPLPLLGGDYRVAADRDGQHVHVLDGKSVATFDRKAATWRTPLGYPAEVVAAFASWKHELLLVANRATQGVDVVWIGGRRISYTIPTGGVPTAMTANRAGTRLYVSLEGQSGVAVVETEQYAVVDRMTTRRLPTALATSPDGARLYVLDDLGDVTAFDLASGREVYKSPVGMAATALAVSADAARVYVATGSGRPLLATLRASDGAFERALPLSGPAVELLASP